MRTIKTKVYKYEELSEAAKARAREWWRAASANDSHESWSEHVTTDLKEVAAFMGWTVTDTAFSGFSSQGDGAKFTGTWRAADVRDMATLETYAPADANERNAKLRDIMAAHVAIAKEAPESSASAWGTGRYSHSMATRFDSPDMHGEPFGRLAENARALMDWYYRGLELSYEHEQSDEVVAGTITANEYEFKENGDRFSG